MNFALTSAFATVLAPCVLAVGSGDPPAGLIVETTLEEVRDNPDAFKHIWVRFPVQFCSIGKVQNPFFTRFVPADFANFYCWSADQPIWEKESYDDLFGMLFLSKEGAQLEQLYTVKLYDRLWITGIVRNVFQDKPWIEVSEFESMSGKVNTASLAHMYRAQQHMSRREWTRAVSELSMAPADDLPTFVQAAVHKAMGLCYLRMGESATAVEHLNSAVTLESKPDRETAELVRTAMESPEAGIDRGVDATSVNDAERPMWEAFQNVSGSSAR